MANLHVSKSLIASVVGFHRYMQSHNACTLAHYELFFAIATDFTVAWSEKQLQQGTNISTSKI